MGLSRPGENGTRPLHAHLLTLVSVLHRWTQASSIYGWKFISSSLSFTLTTASSLAVPPKLIADYKAKFNARYALTDLGPVSWLLGLKVTHNYDNRTISLSQTAYINTMLDHFALTDTKPFHSPMVPGIIYSKDDTPSSPQEAACMEKAPYHEAIGSLIYTSIATCSNISFAVTALS